jgi:hypothetical protein
VRNTWGKTRAESEKNVSKHEGKKYAKTVSEERAPVSGARELRGEDVIDWALLVRSL